MPCARFDTIKPGTYSGYLLVAEPAAPLFAALSCSHVGPPPGYEVREINP